MTNWAVLDESRKFRGLRWLVPAFESTLAWA